MKRKLIGLMLGVAALAALSVGAVLADDDERDSRGVNWEISVTNLTKGQPLSPITVATHTNRLTPLYVPGEAASAELAAVAEDADNSGLTALWNPATNDNVNDLQTILGVNGPILPGETASVVVSSKGRARYLSLVGMLVNTNDAFTAVNGAELSRSSNGMIWTPAYDAGSEVNNEDCGYIPGPACTGGAGMRALNGEGYVYIHSGVHGIADLSAADHDFNNPVALIKITRTR